MITSLKELREKYGKKSSEREALMEVSENLLSSVWLLQDLECKCSKDDILNCYRCALINDIKAVYSEVRKIILNNK